MAFRRKSSKTVHTERIANKGCFFVPKHILLRLYHFFTSFSEAGFISSGKNMRRTKLQAIRASSQIPTAILIRRFTFCLISSASYPLPHKHALRYFKNRVHSAIHQHHLQHLPHSVH